MYDPHRLDRRDPDFIRKVLPAFRAFNQRYVRLQVRNAEALRTTRPALYVSNHNGGIMGPDLACTMGTLWDTLGPETPLYALAHDFAMRQFTPLGRVLQRFGALPASPESAERALRAGASVLVYPGGDLDAFRHFRKRDEIVLGERRGFVRLAIRLGVPVVPIVVHGAHRSAVIVAEGKRIASVTGMKRWARLERFPIALALPWGIAAGPWIPYLPLPFRVRMHVLPAMTLEGDPLEERERVRAAMQRALDALAAEG
ncbi:MAG: lysophospholipid acyltransferase family protein [Myxococcales bacterium]